jgi:hypothetical protein
MFLDLGIRQLAPQRFQARQSAFLVGTHQSAVTGDIRGENGGQPAFDASRGQSGAPRPHEQEIDYRLSGALYSEG